MNIFLEQKSIFERQLSQFLYRTLNTNNVNGLVISWHYEKTKDSLILLL